ncbi:MAG: S-layer homology domain-containing protein [Peptococcaceae bacterium]|nr:MAG: S-layer homology domain-containing protein [Peptococcaceae bacterium]
MFKWRKVLNGFLVFLLVFFLPAGAMPEVPGTFGDIQGHWAQKDVELLAARGIIEGEAPGVFTPERALTRAELAKLLVKLLGLKETGSPTLAFTDVLPGSWYYGAVGTAAGVGLMVGDGENFRPGDTLTREEMAAVAVRLAGLKEAESVLPFADAPEISPWAVSAVRAAYAQGLMQGVSSELFAPGAAVTRAQATVLLVRLAERKGLFEEMVTLEGKLVFSDLEGSHYELATAGGNYVLLVETTDKGMESLLAGYRDQNVRVTGYLHSGPTIYMRGQAMRVIKVEPAAG